MTIKEIEDLEDDYKILEIERERLSKLLIEARVEIVKLRVGIKEHRDTEIGDHYKIEQMELRDGELYKLLEEKDDLSKND